MSEHPRQYDVVIVGGGPAGSSTAIRLARAGVSVALLEQKKFPRQKLCGEFVSPECIAHFAELDALDAIREDAVALERTVFYARNGSSVEVPSEWFGASHAMGISRAQMDARLLQRARDVGVDVIEEARVSSLLFDDERVAGVSARDASGNAIDVRSKLTLDATGRARVLSREVRKAFNKDRTSRAPYVAFKTHLIGAAIRDADCEIYGYPGGYGGTSRVENGLYNLCFIVSSNIARRHRGDAEAIMKNVLFLNRRASRALINAEIVNDWLAVPIEQYGRAELAPAEGLLAVGDAAGFIDPFTGSGILLALESGKLLSELVERNQGHDFATLAADYERRYHGAFDRRLRISSLVRRAAFVPFLGEAVVRTLSLSRGLTRILARSTRPAQTSQIPSE